MDSCKDGVCGVDIHKIDNGAYGVTRYGFRRKLFPECVAERIERARRVFGVNIDTSETSFLGKLIRNMAWDEAYLWELAEDVYMSPFVNTAEGTALDNVGMYLTITRRPATKSKGILTIYGIVGTIVEKGFKVATKTNILYETLETATIGEQGNVEVLIESIGAGKEFNVADGTLTEIVNPQFGVDRVVNGAKTEGGLDIESDDEFRTRYKKSYSRVGGSTVPAITAALLDLEKVIDCEVRENVTMEEVDGIPPKSFECYVYGGEDKSIAETIYQNKAAGIRAYGSTVIEIKDTRGEMHQIGFTRAKVQDVWVKLIVTKDLDYKGDEAVKRAVLNYIGGADTDGIEYPGLKLGADVVFSKVLGRVMCLGGVADVQVELSSDGEVYKPTTIEVARNAIARTKMDRIVISYA